MSEQAQSSERYLVVINDLSQLSIWPARRALPAGWRSISVIGDREQCLQHIEASWREMQPRTGP
jgi:MbtH protein